MQIINPDNIKQIDKIIKDLKGEKYIVSPFMFENYETAIEKTIEIIQKGNIKFIIDITGLTNIVYQKMFGYKQDENNTFDMINKNIKNLRYINSINEKGFVLCERVMFTTDDYSNINRRYKDGVITYAGKKGCTILCDGISLSIHNNSIKKIHYEIGEEIYILDEDYNILCPAIFHKIDTERNIVTVSFNLYDEYTNKPLFEYEQRYIKKIIRR